MQRELNFFQSWLHRTLQRWADAIEKFGERMEQPVAKQKAKQESNGLTYQELKDRIEIKGTNVTDPNVYTQDWHKEETPSERMERLEALMLNKAKIVKKSA